MITSPDEWKHIFESSGCLNPLAVRADEAFDRLLGMAGDPADLLEGSAAESIRKLLYDRLANLHLPLLCDLLAGNMDKSSYMDCVVFSDSCTPKLLQAAEELAGKLEGGGWDRAMEKAPAAVALNRKITENFIASQAEFLERYRRYRPEISERFFGGRDSGRILSYINTQAIPKQHGRIVIGVRCEGGCFYYKPHDCGIDSFYHEITERFFSDITRAADVIKGSGFGFCTQLVPKPLEKREDIARYFYNYGAIAALFTALNGADLHGLNVLACGVYPCAIDLENLLSVTVDRSGAALTDAEKAEMLSISSLCLLGHRNYLDVSLRSALYLAENDPLRINLPEYEGRTHDICGYEETFIDGFRDGYARMARAKQAVLSSLEKHPQVFVRNLFISPKLHQILLRMLLQPDSLRSAAAQDEVLARLRLGYTGSGKKLNESVLRYEEACLREADLPYYCVDIFRRDLYGADRTVISENEFVRSPCACLRDRLDSLCEAEQQMELTLIRRSFEHLLTDDPAEYACPLREGTKPIDPETAEKELKEMLSAVCGDGIRAPDGTVFWLDSMLEYAGKRNVPFCAVQADVAALCGGILLFTQDGELKIRAVSLLDQCLDSVEEKLALWKRSGKVTAEPGLVCGAGGLLNGLRLAEGSSERAESAIRDLLTLLSEDPFEAESRLDADAGIAGLLIALSALPERKDGTAEAARRALLERLADRLSRALDDPETLAGLSRIRDPFRGSCAVAAALAMARKVSRRQASYTDRVQSLFSAVSGSYSESICGWYSSDKNRRFQKGNYAAGIGLCAAAALSGADDPNGAVRKCLDLAIRSEMNEDSLFRQDVLLNGNALRAVFLDRCEELFPGMGYGERAGRILSRMLERKQENGGFILSPQGIRNVFAPSFMLGVSGIGTALLKHMGTEG